MKLKRLIFLLILAFGTSTVFSQQEPLFQHNYLNPFVYNPGYAGMNDQAEIAAFRNQKWAEFNGGIISNLINFHSRINQSNSSVGIQLNTDNIGLSSRVKAHAAYAYRIKLSENLILQPGLSFGIVDQRINYAGILADINDPILTQAFDANKTGLDANFGLYMKFKNFNFGVSVPQLLDNKLSLVSGGETNYQLNRQYVLNTSYTFKSSNNENLFVKPDVLVIHSPQLPLHYSVSLLTGLNNIGWLGATYKSDYAIGANIGLSLKNQFKIGFAYDIPIGEMANITNSNNFEIALLYQFGRSDANSKSSKPKQQVLENRLKDVIRQQEIKDSIHAATVDSLNTELNIKQLENKVLADENILIKNNNLTVLDDTLKGNDVSQNNQGSTGNTGNTGNSSNSGNSGNGQNINNGTNIKVEQKQDNKRPVEDIQTQSIKIKDDYFTEVLNNAVAPDGYYVVTGMYSSKDEAERLLAIARTKFDSPRLLVNQRNQKYYVVLYYSENIDGVIEAIITSNTIKAPGFSKAWALNYFKR